MDAIRSSGLKLGADPLGGASVEYWEKIAEKYGLNLTVVNPEGRSHLQLHDRRSRRQDPHGLLQPLRHGGPGQAQGPVQRRLRKRSRLRPARHRHALRRADEPEPLPGGGDPVPVDQSAALAGVGRGRQDAGQQQHDRPRRRALGRKLSEVPVGFKWFAGGLFDGSYCFGGEESAGASFLRKDGTVWTTDKDGIILNLLAAEITARTGKDPGVHYAELTKIFGSPYYTRIDAPASPQQKAAFKKLTPEAVTDTELAGEPIIAKLTRAPATTRRSAG